MLMGDLVGIFLDRSVLSIVLPTTGNSGFAESPKLYAKVTKPSAKPLPRVTLGKGPTGNFFSDTILCPAPEL
jgi:hypothetical protein